MSVIGPRPGLWNQDILTAERDKRRTDTIIFFSCIPEKIPDIDILACDFFRESVSDSGDDKAEIYSFNYAIKTLLDYKAPSVICAVLSQTYLKSDEFRGLLEYINGRGYHYIYKAMLRM